MAIVMVPDSERKPTLVWEGEYNGTRVELLTNPITEVYNMRVFKHNRLIAETVDEYQDIGAMLAKLLDAIPIDPQFLKLH